MNSLLNDLIVCETVAIPTIVTIIQNHATMRLWARTQRVTMVIMIGSIPCSL